MRQFFASLLEIVEVALIAIGAVVLIRSFLVQPFLVSGSSMVPSFSNGDYLLVDELTYLIRTPRRGEVVVFNYPKDPAVYFIKRIIGLPGETVTIKESRVKIFNSENPEGIVLEEQYLPANLPIIGNTEATLGPNEYFVMGDNRSFSYDSRSWGSLSEESIIGLVRLRLYPLRHIQAFAAPQY